VAVSTCYGSRNSKRLHLANPGFVADTQRSTRRMVTHSWGTHPRQDNVPSFALG
jgi:hypothetical protein